MHMSKENSIFKSTGSDTKHLNPEMAPAIIPNKIALIFGLFVLFLGGLVYIALRPPAQIYFIRFFGIEQLSFEIHSNIVKSIGYRLPACLHVFSFCLITASFFKFNKNIYLTICSGWLVVDTFFELGQKYKDFSSRMVPDFFAKIPFLEGTYNYFRLGTFDYYDLFAYALGALAAFCYLIKSSGKPT